MHDSMCLEFEKPSGRQKGRLPSRIRIAYKLITSYQFVKAEHKTKMLYGKGPLSKEVQKDMKVRSVKIIATRPHRLIPPAPNNENAVNQGHNTTPSI